MKSLFLVLIVANLTAGAWLLLQEPVGVVREPGRMDLQLEQGRVQILTEAQMLKAKQKADSDAAAAAAAAGTAAATPGGTATATAAPATAAGSASAPAVEVPLASCIDIGPFASEAATRKVRARLATAGLGDHLSTTTADKVTQLHITGVDAAGEAQIHDILHDFSKQEISHCFEAPPAARPAH